MIICFPLKLDFVEAGKKTVSQQSDLFMKHQSPMNVRQKSAIKRKETPLVLQCNQVKVLVCTSHVCASVCPSMFHFHPDKKCKNLTEQLGLQLQEHVIAIQMPEKSWHCLVFVGAFQNAAERQQSHCELSKINSQMNGTALILQCKTLHLLHWHCRVTVACLQERTSWSGRCTCTMLVHCSASSEEWLSEKAHAHCFCSSSQP